MQLAEIRSTLHAQIKEALYWLNHENVEKTITELKISIHLCHLHKEAVESERRYEEYRNGPYYVAPFCNGTS